MAKIERVNTPLEERVDTTDVVALREHFEACEAELQTQREFRQHIRDTVPRSKVRAALAEHDPVFQAAVEKVNRAERVWRRAEFGGNAGQRVAIEPAVEGEAAGGDG